MLICSSFGMCFYDIAFLFFIIIYFGVSCFLHHELGMNVQCVHKQVHKLLNLLNDKYCFCLYYIFVSVYDVNKV